MTRAPALAVVATQIARTDRRALSQAWYSALHLAHAAQPAPRPARSAHATAPASARRPASAARVVAPPQAAAKIAAHEHAATGAARAVVLERRCEPSAATRRIERAVARMTVVTQPPFGRTIDLGTGRVRLLVRSDGQTTRIVAVCATPLRAVVERALARARFTLAASTPVPAR